TQALRNQSAFFQSIAGRVYQGQLRYVPPFNRENSRTLNMHFHSNPRTRDPAREYWVIYRYDGKQEQDILENRYASYSTTPDFFRFNSCSSGVSILNDRCALLAGYDLEYIDLFEFQGALS